MPKIDIAKAPVRTGTGYPKPFAERSKDREVVQLGNAAGLSQFGVNIVTLKPGTWASQRHWHHKEDEFAYVLEGELVLIENEGETLLKAGDCAAWKAGVANGHHLINRSGSDAKFLIVGTRNDEDWGEYPDIDLRSWPGRYSGTSRGFTRKDGTPY